MQRFTLILTFLLYISIALSQPCPDSLYLTSQTQVDSFQIMYPNCHEIYGNVYILGNDITNLNGLNNLISIGGGLSISNTSLTNLTGLEGIISVGSSLFVGSNWLLTSLTGLEGLTSVGSWLKIYSNEYLSCLSGLQNLTAIGGNLIIDGQYGGNSSLTDLTGLEGLLSIGDKIFILRNDGLTSLSGIDNIDPSSILNIYIHHNSSLSDCDVLSICNFLAFSIGSPVVISSNSSGCNSPEEVQDSCEANAVMIYEQDVNNTYILYPNPTSNYFWLNLKPDVEVVAIEIFNIQGKEVMQQKVLSSNLSFNISQFPNGIYYIRIYTSKGIDVKKLIVQ